MNQEPDNAAVSRPFPPPEPPAPAPAAGENPRPRPDRGASFVARVTPVGMHSHDDSPARLRAWCDRIDTISRHGRACPGHPRL
jgi:hypothetical protein